MPKPGETIKVRIKEEELRKLLHPMGKREAIYHVFTTLNRAGMQTTHPKMIRFARHGNDALFEGPPV